MFYSLSWNDKQKDCSARLPLKCIKFRGGAAIKPGLRLCGVIYSLNTHVSCCININEFGYNVLWQTLLRILLKFTL